RDWSSDVCSSDLAKVKLLAAAATRISAALPAAKAIAGRIALGINFAAVILRALILVEQQVISFSDVGKPLRRLWIILVAVGMQFFGKFAIGAFNILFAGALCHTQCLIRICHYLPFFNSL